MATDLRQNHFRFGYDDGTESTHTFIAAQDTVTCLALDTTYLLRIIVQESGGTAAANTDWTWQYKLNGGSWTAITTSSSVARAVTPNAWANGAHCTNRLSKSGTFESSGAGCTTDGTAGGTANDIAASGCSETELAFQLRSADVAYGDVVYFHVISPDFTVTNNVNPSAYIRATIATQYEAVGVEENVSLMGSILELPVIRKALLDESGSPLTDEDGNYLISEESNGEDVGLTESLAFSLVVGVEDVEIATSEVITTSEDGARYLGQKYIVTSEALGVTEDGARYLAQRYISGVFDSISAAEEITKYLAQDYISISDSINIDESIIVTFASLNITVNDLVNTTESINEYLAQKYISVNDSVNLSENISRIFGQQYITGIYDDVSVSENLGINRSQLFITSLDSLNLLEENSLSFAGSVYASVFDSINVDESINKRFGQVLINSNDSITFSESQSLRYGQLNIQPYESIGLSESNAFVFSGPRYITVDDSIGNVDVVNTVFGQLYIKSFDYLVDEEGNYLTDEDGNKLIFTTNIYDGVGFTENVSFGTTEAYRSISVYDGIDLSEDISQYSGQRQISSFESIGLSESLSSYFQPQNINVSESIAVSENLTSVFGQLYLKTVVYLTDEDGNYLTDEDGNRILFDSAIFDSISVDDTPSVSTFQLKPTLYDSISIDELVTLSTVRPLYIGATNYFTDESGNRLTDEAGNYLVSSESIFETLGITESISLSRSAVTSLSASINDSISITEDVNTGYIVEDIGIIFDRLISVSDSIAFDEYFNGLRTPVIEKYDTIGLTDSVSVYAGIKSYQSIFVYDDVSLAEYLNFTNVVEDIELLLDVDARVDDSISINESIALNRSAGYNEIKVSDTITPEEFIASYLSSHKISVYDEVGVAEANFASTGLTIKMVEDIGILESTAQYFRQKYVDTSDSLSIDDSANLSLNNNINANDSISVDESISVRFNYLELISSDSITLNDANSVIRSPELIAFYDTIGVSESIALRFRHLMINSNESIGMDESTNLSLRTFRPFWAAGANVIIQPGVTS